MELDIQTGIKGEDIEKIIGLYSFGVEVFKEKLRFEKGEVSEGKIVYLVGEKTFTADAGDFRNLMSGLVKAIKQYENLEKVMITGFGKLNRFDLNVPDVYKTGEDDSKEFKKLFE